MNNIKELLDNYNLHLKNIRYLNHTKVLETDEETYTLRTRKRANKDLFSYLKGKNFEHYLPLENSPDDPYELYRFVREPDMNFSDKAIDLVYTMAMLHIKTTTYELVNLDEIKNIYEETNATLSHLQSYYLELQNNIESKIYMSPAEYLLMRNISKVYGAINFSRYTLEKWYKEKENQKKERQVLLHNNITLDHYIKAELTYFINWDQAKRGPVIYDFLNFYKNEYLNLEMESLFNIYQSKYQYTTDEKLLFFALLAVPIKINLKSTNYLNTLEVRNLVMYLEKTNNFISKEYKENQKANEEKLDQ